MELVQEELTPQDPSKFIKSSPEDIQVCHSRVVPIRSLDSGHIKMELFVEESGIKPSSQLYTE